MQDLAKLSDLARAELDALAAEGVPVRVDGVAQIKVKGDDVSIATAAEQFLSKTTDEIKGVAMQTLEGHLRAILGTMTVEDIYQNRDAFASKVQEVAAGDMANMGLGIVSFTIRDIRDTQGYLDALGKPRIAQVKRDAQIAQAEADRDAMIERLGVQPHHHHRMPRPMTPIALPAADVQRGAQAGAQVDVAVQGGGAAIGPHGQQNLLALGRIGRHRGRLASM